MPPAAAKRRIWLADSKGLLTTQRADELSPAKRAFAQDASAVPALVLPSGSGKPGRPAYDLADLVRLGQAAGGTCGMANGLKMPSTWFNRRGGE